MTASSNLLAALDDPKFLASQYGDPPSSPEHSGSDDSDILTANPLKRRLPTSINEAIEDSEERKKRQASDEWRKIIGSDEAAAGPSSKYTPQCICF